MKKSLVLAALVTMCATSAKAGFCVYVDPYFAENVSTATAAEYSKVYIVSAADYNAWWGGGHEDVNSLNNVIMEGNLQYGGTRHASLFYETYDFEVERAAKFAGYDGDLGETINYDIPAAASYAVIYNPTTKDAFGLANLGYDAANDMLVRFGDGSMMGMVNYNNESSPYGTSAPEPTSGLLLLLGVAGLALKRRRV